MPPHPFHPPRANPITLEGESQSLRMSVPKTNTSSSTDDQASLNDASLLTEQAKLHRSEGVSHLKKQLLDLLVAGREQITGPRPSTSAARSQYLRTVQEFETLRGRALFFPILSSGLGRGPLIELLDGSVKYDMISGLGIHFLGHSHPAFIEEALEGLTSDPMQGHLVPSAEVHALLREMLSLVGSDSRLKHGWVVCSGSMANEMALKIARQSRQPATKILAFRDCFAGRSIAMQEVTDNPSYRQGQPLYGEVHYIPFFNPKVGLEQSIRDSQAAMREHLLAHPGKFATMMVELVQGEGGFQFAPREFYLTLLEEAKKAGLVIWVDEVQTFGRTGELFAYQKFDLAPLVDLVTVGKMLQVCMVLYTQELNPKPGLIAGTFAGSSIAIRSAHRTLRELQQGQYFGSEGKITRLSQVWQDGLRALSEGSCKALIHEVRVLGGMVAFLPFSGTLEIVKRLLMELFDQGVIAFYCGHGPYLIRMLPPLGVMTEAEIAAVLAIIETALLKLHTQSVKVAAHGTLAHDTPATLMSQERLT